MRHANPQGFTLIETVVYVALLAILMGGTLLAAYQLLRSSGATSARDAAGMEGNFVRGKIAWALAGAESVLLPSASRRSGSVLSVKRYDGLLVTIRLDSAGHAIEMSEGGAYLPLAAGARTDAGLTFTRLTGPGGTEGVEAVIVLDGRTFYSKKYARK